MCWLKGDRWKAGITLAGVLLLLVLMVGVPVLAVGAQKEASTLGEPGTVMVQATPTEDATVTELNKEKLAQEVQQLKNQNEPDLLGWLRTNAAILLSTLVVVVGGLIGLFRWFGDRRSEREKRAEERFQAAVTGLGEEKEGARVGAAILLRTFLRPGYDQFYTQTFDLAVAHLRLPRITAPVDGDPDNPLPLTTLSQALIVVFKEAFPLTRERLKKRQTFFPQRIKARLHGRKIRLERIGMEKTFDPQSLDATAIQLDNAYLSGADLHQVWMPGASMRGTNLSGTETNLSWANLSGADLSRANLQWANLSHASLPGANLSGADLSGADLSGANLYDANLSEAKLLQVNLHDAGLEKAKFNGADLRGSGLIGASLGEADFSGAKLNGADLSSVIGSGPYLSGPKLNGADLSGADLSGAVLIDADLSGAVLIDANLSGAKLNGANLSQTNLEYALAIGPLSLKGTDLRGVKGQTREQLEACKAKGAIIDEVPTSSASQSTVSPPPPSQSDDVQAPSVPLVQGSNPPADTDGNSTTSSKLGSES